MRWGRSRDEDKKWQLTGKPRFRRGQFDYSIEHGVTAAAKEFGASERSVKRWRKEFGIRVERGRGWIASDEFKKEAVNYSLERGVPAAAKKFGVSQSSLYLWRKQFGIT